MAHKGVSKSFQTESITK